MYSNSSEYFTTLEFTTVNKSLWKQVFNKKEHHDLRKELGVTYAGYSSNRKDSNMMSVAFKYDDSEKMKTTVIKYTNSLIKTEKNGVN